VHHPREFLIENFIPRETISELNRNKSIQRQVQVLQSVTNVMLYRDAIGQGDHQGKEASEQTKESKATNQT
jgi:hypothetical protein